MSPRVVKATTGTVYALLDPRDNAVRYVGQTVKPLPERLAGHIKTTVPNVNAWVKELGEAGLEPDIIALHEQVPAAELRKVEREEITLRLVAGARLLNEGSTAAARKILQLRAEEARKESWRCGWEDVAHMSRAVLGGPLPPGDLPPVPFPLRVWEGLQQLWALPDPGDPDPRDLEQVDVWSRHMTVRGKYQDILWRHIRSAWGPMRGTLHDSEDDLLESVATAVVNARWDSPQDASRFVTLAPWLLLAVRPWIDLARKAELSTDPVDFVAWVSDDPQVRAALEFVGQHAPQVFSMLAVDKNPYDPARMAKFLAVTAAAHGRFALPEAVQDELVQTLREVARQQMLTPPMADLLARLDPHALDDVFGRDLAGDADAALGLPTGTAASVLQYLLDHPPANTGSLSRVVARAAGVLPSRPFPDYRTWEGPSVRTAEVTVASLVNAGLLEPPAGTTTEALLARIRGLWTMNAQWTKHYPDGRYEAA